ncbi:type III PLP-dependent enzyme [Radicibacter daui]|uniref:type III PLP-dependent enzyme n=1 Tax=Radicibacter daui TaxID=3064829 RepID=UPI0040469FC3
MTDRIIRFLRDRRPSTPCVVVDLDRVEENYRALAGALPNSRIFYAVKANPGAPVLKRLADLGSCFDTASVPEIEMALAAGATPDRISFGNTIKKQGDIARAYQLGVRLYAYDSVEELEKIAASAPGSKVFCRILTDGAGAEWPLSRKFGCVPEMAQDLLVKAADFGLQPVGVSFHVGSQQCNVEAWDGALAQAAAIFRHCEANGIELSLVNLGGGFPTRYRNGVPTAEIYGRAIDASLKRHFGNHMPDTIIEPGRGMVGDAGIIESEVVLVARKSYDADERPWVYLDVGKFGGLAETMDESIRYQISTPHDGGEDQPVIIAGPTCDSADVLYEKNVYRLPTALKAGDRVRILSTGAYTTSYSAVNFNGFAPLAAHYI